jgi:hypothetical protein
MKLSFSMSLLVALAIVAGPCSSTIAAQTIVGGNCGRHGPWKGSSDCPGCIRERNMPPPGPPPVPREPTKEEIQAQRLAARLAAIQLRLIEEERDQKKLDTTQKMESDVQSALRSLKDTDAGSTYTPGLKNDDDFAFRPSPTGPGAGGSKTLFERGNKGSAPVDSRVKGRSLLDVPELRLEPRDLSQLFPKAGDPPVQAPDPKDLEYLFPKEFGVQAPAADDLRFLFPQEMETGRKWPGPVRRGSRLYNPLREPDRAALDFEMDSSIVEQGKRKEAKSPAATVSSKYERAKQFLSAKADWSDFRKEIFAAIPNLPLNRSPQFMAALQERCGTLYKEHAEAYGRLLFVTIDECAAEYRVLAEKQGLTLNDFVLKAQNDEAAARLRDTAWTRVDERRNRKLEGIIVKFEVELESDMKRLLAEQGSKK